MTQHLTIGTIIEKNKIASNNAFIILMQADIIDMDNGAAPVTSLYFCKNSENIEYQGNLYIASNFDIKIDQGANQEPSVSLATKDYTRTIQQYVEAYSGCVGSTITMTVVNTGNINGAPEISESFKVISASSAEYVVTFELGTPAAVNRRFPLYVQNKDVCAWQYRSKRCGYTGILPTCDFTLEGGNGCVKHANSGNYGGFPGMNVDGSGG